MREPAAQLDEDSRPVRQRRPRLGRKIAEALRRRILAGDFKPGERLIEDRLSAEFGVSRVPIREALRTLIADGLVVPTPTRGACVAELSREIACELAEVRATLEGLNARLAARHRKPELVALLREVLERGNAAAARGAPAEELARLNGEFHDTLALAGSNSVLQDIVRTLRERTELVFRRNSAERAAADWREHAMILSAVVDGDSELAELLATRHVHNAAAARLKALETEGARSQEAAE
jgi:DNA-binding GntR family transcriptional regulator